VDRPGIRAGEEELISTGRGAMPSWRQLPEQERWALVRLIRTLKK
jgi:hypothetical protein